MVVVTIITIFEAPITDMTDDFNISLPADTDRGDMSMFLLTIYVV